MCNAISTRIREIAERGPFTDHQDPALSAWFMGGELFCAVSEFIEEPARRHEGGYLGFLENTDNRRTFLLLVAEAHNA